jgi:hypothetical protein
VEAVVGPDVEAVMPARLMHGRQPDPHVVLDGSGRVRTGPRRVCRLVSMLHNVRILDSGNKEPQKSYLQDLSFISTCSGLMSAKIQVCQIFPDTLYQNRPIFH